MAQADKATYNLEICMTELDEKLARQFFRTLGKEERHL